MDLLPLKKHSFEGSLAFSEDWQPHEMDVLDHNVRLQKPLHVTGEVWKDEDCLLANIELNGDVELQCDRCNEWYEHRMDMEYQALYCPPEQWAQLIEEQDETMYYGKWQGQTLDIGSSIIEQIILNLPTKKLCRKDCQGLCPQCGRNLNREQCSCRQDNLDPRLAALGDWYDASKD